MTNTIKLPFYARLACILISVVLILFLLKMGANIFIPLVFGLLGSILMYPLNRFLEVRLGMGRSWAALLCLLTYLLGMGLFFYFLTSQAISFAHDFPDLKVRFRATSADLQHWIYARFHVNNAEQLAYVNKSATGYVEAALESASNVIFSLTSILFLAVFAFIFTFFMLFHRRMLMRFTLHLFSIEHREKVKEVILETRSMINSYVVGLLLEMLIMSVANSALLLVLGVKYAILLGLVAAVLNIIPYIGIYSAIVLIMFVTFANGSAGLAAEAGLGLFILHFLDSNILMPRIVGSRVKMNPFITILAVIVGEFLWGIPGMFLFIPITGMIKLVCERVEGMEAWGLLIGVDDMPKKVKNKIPADG